MDSDKVTGTVVGVLGDLRENNFTDERGKKVVWVEVALENPTGFDRTERRMYFNMDREVAKAENYTDPSVLDQYRGQLVKAPGVFTLFQGKLTFKISGKFQVIK